MSIENDYGLSELARTLDHIRCVSEPPLTRAESVTGLNHSENGLPVNLRVSRDSKIKPATANRHPNIARSNDGRLPNPAGKK